MEAFNIIHPFGAMIRRGLAVVLAAAMSIEAQTPSFNCNSARTPAEHLICSDVGLADQERGMSERYRQVLDQSEPQAKLELRREQRLWFRAYARACNAPMSEEDRKSCIAYRLTERTLELEAKVAPADESIAGACAEGLVVALAVLLVGAMVLDAMGGGGVATLTATAIIKAAAGGCVTEVLHEAIKRSRRQASLAQAPRP